MSEQIDHYQRKLSYETDSADLFELLESKRDVVVVDARSEDAYKREHIPGAINIPHRTMSEDTAAQLDKALTYISYCDGVGCNASTKGALNLARLGFKVSELIGGLDWWRRDGYATEGSHATKGKQTDCGC